MSTTTTKSHDWMDRLTTVLVPIATTALVAIAALLWGPEPAAEAVIFGTLAAVVAAPTTLAAVAGLQRLGLSRRRAWLAFALIAHVIVTGGLSVWLFPDVDGLFTVLMATTPPIVGITAVVVGGTFAGVSLRERLRE